MATAYNPGLWSANCNRSCGNISVPFPFGLEDGCSGRKELQLYCVDPASSTLKLSSIGDQVSYINVSEGVMGLNQTTRNNTKDLSDFYSTSTLTIRESHWVVANLTCQEAQQDNATYACLSSNSTCSGLNATYIFAEIYMGYRCQCNLGFQGNPYVPDGCQGSR